MKIVIFFIATFLSFPSVAEIKEYRRILAFKPLHFSPHYLNDAYSYQIVLQCSMGLVRLSPTNEIEPGIAESWTVSRDRKTYTFKLRPGLKYSDGTDFQINDIVETMNNSLRADSILLKELSVIEGTSEFSKGKIDRVTGLTVVNPTTLQIKLAKIYPPFLGLLGSANFAIFKPEDLKRLREQKVGVFVGLGPFALETLNDKQIVLKKNRYFFDSENVYWDRIVYDVGLSETEARAAFAKGKYDDIFPFQPSDEEATLAGAQKIPSFLASNWYLQFNLTRPFVKQLAFRQFIFKAFDFDAFLAEMKIPNHQRSYGGIPRGFLGFKEKRELNTKVSPGELLKRAGCSNKTPCKVTLEHPYPLHHEALLKGFRTVNAFEGVAVNVELLDRSKWYKKFSTGDYSLVAVSNSSFYPDTFVFLKYLLQPEYHPGLQREKIEQILDKTLLTEDRTERQKLFEKADDILFEQMGIVPIYYGETPFRWMSKRLEPVAIPILGLSNLRMDTVREKALKK